MRTMSDLRAPDRRQAYGRRQTRRSRRPAAPGPTRSAPVLRRREVDHPEFLVRQPSLQDHERPVVVAEKNEASTSRDSGTSSGSTCGVPSALMALTGITVPTSAAGVDEKPPPGVTRPDQARSRRRAQSAFLASSDGTLKSRGPPSRIAATAIHSLSGDQAGGPRTSSPSATSRACASVRVDDIEPHLAPCRCTTKASRWPSCRQRRPSPDPAVRSAPDLRRSRSPLPPRLQSPSVPAFGARWTMKPSPIRGETVRCVGSEICSDVSGASHRVAERRLARASRWVATRLPRCAARPSWQRSRSTDDSRLSRAAICACSRSQGVEPGDRNRPAAVARYSSVSLVEQHGEN